jgi:ribosome-associated protein
MVVKNNILSYIAQAIYDKKGVNILAMDIRKNNFLYDYIIIAEGTIERHVKAIAQYVIDKMAEKNQKPLFVEGMELADWIILDYGYIAIHLLTPEMKQKYQLEHLWNKAKIIKLNIKIEKQLKHTKSKRSKRK